MIAITLVASVTFGFQIDARQIPTIMQYIKSAGYPLTGKAVISASDNHDGDVGETERDIESTSDLTVFFALCEPPDEDTEPPIWSARYVEYSPMPIGRVTDLFAFVTPNGSFFFMLCSYTRAMGRVLDVARYDLIVTKVKGRLHTQRRYFP